MVNVNKNIVPGKLAESSAKTEPQAPARRPRNQELNSSKKTVGVTHGETHATEQNPFKAKLNCSRKLNCSVTGNITSDVYDKLYTREDDPQKVADALGCTVEDVKEIDSETEDLGYGKTVGYLLAKPEYEEELSRNGIEILSILEDGTVGMMVGRGFHTVETDLELVLDRVGENLDSACGSEEMNSSEDDLDSACGGKSDLDSAEGDGTASGIITLYDDFAKLKDFDIEKLIKERVTRMIPDADVTIEKLNDTQMKVTVKCADADITRAKLAIESSDVAKSVDWSDKLNNSVETNDDSEGSNLNCSGGESEESEDVKVVTESGNEVDMREIKVVQDPNTNELALFIPENEDDVIPEGFIVIGDVVSTATIDMSAEGEESEDPEEELDSSKQSMNSSVSHPNRAARRRRNNSKKKN